MFVCLMLRSALAMAPSTALDSNHFAQGGFEAGTTGWSFWARTPDSARMSASSEARSGTGALRVSSEGQQDWSLSASNTRVAVQPGQMWTVSFSVRRDSLEGEATAGFVLADSAGNTVAWNAGAVNAPTTTGWNTVVSHLAVPRGIATIQPRLTGRGPLRATVDDALFVLSEPPPASVSELVVSNDSVVLRVDPIDLSMTLSDTHGPDTLRLGGLPDFRLESFRSAPDTLELRLRHLAGSFPARLSLTLRGGSLHLRLTADPLASLPGPFDFPGAIATRPGQRIAIPRGTGLSWPVDGPRSWRWVLSEAPFWGWQVSQALTGATDGKTGFVLSCASPANAGLSIRKSGSEPSHPRIVQSPAKGRFGQAREAVVAPLRGGGFRELALRHRLHREGLGQVKDWTAKRAANPDMEKLHGAVDWWVQGGNWSWKMFDTLRWMGMDKAVIHWNWASKATIDSLARRDWLVSVYDNWADAFPGDTSALGREYATGTIVQQDGSPMKGWLAYESDGSTRQALEICAARHPHLARTLGGAERTNTRRNARFVDVELAISLPECWHADHPVDRDQDLAQRLRALSIVKDSLGFVTGSEQTRDAAHAVVDYGEGPMSIASVADAGYDWETPEAPEPFMDSLSMDPALRVPLLPLADHDAFSPTWYTGDGQSKVPARWDDKDAWNMLYATMPLVMPANNAMWDTLRPRYLRSIVAIGSLLRRCHFQAMTTWNVLSEDRKVQHTTFANGWTVTANFDKVPRLEAGQELPAKGFLATSGAERIERAVLDGAVRTRVRQSDRWFLDPEGSQATIDGLRTSGSVFIQRLDDTTLALSLVGNQTSVDLSPLNLPWPAPSVRAARRTTGAAVILSDLGEGWTRLIAPPGERFFLLRGNFAAFRTSLAPRTSLPGAALVRGPRGWQVRWFQSAAGPVLLERFDAKGRIEKLPRVQGESGSNSLDLPTAAVPTWIRITAPEGKRILSIPPVR